MPDELTKDRKLRLDLEEISGLAIDARAGGPVRLLAIGDASFTVLAVDIDADGATSAEQRYELGALLALGPDGEQGEKDEHRAGDSQWEAIACDAAGNVLVLRETPATVYVFDPKLAARLATVTLEPPPDLDQESGGEGLLLLDGGHLLVIYEEEPPLLVEYGPKGEAPVGLTAASLQPSTTELTGEVTLVPLKTWTLGDASIDDLSDIAVAPGGDVYLISDESEALLRLQLPLRPEDDEAQVAERWDLPMEDAEGLAFLADGRPVVAVDRPDTAKKNVFVLAWP